MNSFITKLNFLIQEPLAVHDQEIFSIARLKEQLNKNFPFVLAPQE